MKHAVSKLEGTLLNVAVAKAMGLSFSIETRHADRFAANLDGPFPTCFVTRHRILGPAVFCPSDDWREAGDIIDRERITIVCSDGVDGSGPIDWSASVGPYSHYIDEPLPFSSLKDERSSSGPTALIAAMRAYVISRLGSEVELP